MWIERKIVTDEKFKAKSPLGYTVVCLDRQWRHISQGHSIMQKNKEAIIEAIEEVLNEGKRKGEFRPQQSTRSIARYLVSFIDGLMLDTFQLGHEQTKVKEQLSVLLFTLEILINPKSANEE